MGGLFDLCILVLFIAVGFLGVVFEFGVCFGVFILDLGYSDVVFYLGLDFWFGIWMLAPFLNWDFVLGF